MDLSERFLEYIGGVRRYSPKTVETYRNVLGDWREYVGQDDIVAPLTTPVLRGYEVWLMDTKKMDPTSVGLHMSALSSFARFLMKEGLIESNPVRTVKRPKTKKRLPVFYMEESMDEYMNSTRFYASPDVLHTLSGNPGDKTDAGIYEKALGRMIVSLLYSTGIRRSELISLDRSSFDRSRGVLRVRGKGDKMREIPVSSSLSEEISLYLEIERRIGLESDGPLLKTRSGGRLYPTFVDRTIKRELGTVSSITARKSPHVLRHTLATGLLNNGADINSIKELLGHASLAATQIYTHNSIENLKKAYKEAHPRCRSSKK